MTKAKILTSIKEIPAYLKLIGMDFSIVHHMVEELSPKKYSDEYYQTFHEGNYRQTFLVASEHMDYDISLEDGSFFQFTAINENEIHYSFFHRIENILSYEQYVEEYLTEENIETIEQEYAWYLSTDKDRVNSCPIRFDVSKSEYSMGTHAYAHMHIGINTDIRIPVDKIIKPLAFVDFIIKHMYKNYWDRAYLNDSKFKQKVDELKKESETIEIDLFTDTEKRLIYIT